MALVAVPTLTLLGVIGCSETPLFELPASSMFKVRFSFLRAENELPSDVALEANGERGGEWAETDVSPDNVLLDLFT